jgi:dipeptidyl aminopeptidase/acylaminoacyl peptidase
VTADDPPFLMIHGDADRSVPILESESMQQALHSVGVAARLIRVPGGAHGPTFPGAKNLPDLAGEMTRWLDSHLRGQ